ncbi:hypothetical protein [Pelomonas sp. Root1444]|uniref:hypothetical protein n=1 Tax=Pelomonas sp. Root1444 TaxID=1736464 RepID=UPI0007035761|nr:hypothetical protein [Pelomonas sp. Root1444]KQY80151.1 hypothetical protein ASD35_09335 [Pelomonas sp. Root1444]
MRDERPRATARRLALAWGVNPVLCHDVMKVTAMIEFRSLPASCGSGEGLIDATRMRNGSENLLPGAVRT